jgi:hypothetical protein
LRSALICTEKKEGWQKKNSGIGFAVLFAKENESDRLRLLLQTHHLRLLVQR